MNHHITSGGHVDWRAPQDAIRVAFRTLRDDLRTELSGLATVTSPEPPSANAGRDGLDWDPDDVSIRPRSVGAARASWGQSAKRAEVNVSVGAHHLSWVLARDDQAVSFVRQVVDAAVAGRVQLGQHEVDRGGRPSVLRFCRVTLHDGTVLQRPGLGVDLLYLAGAVGPLAPLGPPGPVEWKSWAEPYA